MKRFISIFLLFLFFHTSALTQSISETEARQRAATFLKSMKKGMVSHTLKTRMADELHKVTESEYSYLFTDKSGAFVIIAADQSLPEILAYGPQSSTMPSMIRAYLKNVDATACPKKSEHSATATRSLPYTYTGPAVPPLLKAVRHQEYPYNKYCPHYTESDGTTSTDPCVSGCVATALEEVISYYNRELVLRDTLHGWSTPHYTIPDILPGVSVNTALIRDSYDTPDSYTPEEEEAVALLTYLCGVAVKMDWGLESSGANVQRVAEPLCRAFGYGYVHHVRAYDYTPEDWNRMIWEELQAARPVFFAGAAMRLNGHAFVIDGIDRNGLVHVNWGVDGDYDGYFRLDILNASEPFYDMTEAGQWEGFFCNQEAVFIHPDSIGHVLPEKLERTGKEVVIDEITHDMNPELWKITPMRIRMHNSADYAVNTPLQFFTNLPSDTALFMQGDYIGYTHVTLQPGESTEQLFLGRYDVAGQRILHVSADDEHILYTAPVHIRNGQNENLTFDIPQVDFPSPGVARIIQHISNAEDAGRAGNKTTYELFRGEPLPRHNGNAHVSYCYLQRGETQTDTICFNGLEENTGYTLYVRYPWTIRQSLMFTTPPSTGITDIFPDNPQKEETIYDLSGRIIRNPRPGNLYITGKGRKVFIPR